MAQAKRDENFVPTLLAVSSADGVTPVVVYADPDTHRLLVQATGGSFVNTEVPTGVVGTGNVTFTFTIAPKVIVVDQGRVMMEDSGWSIAGLVVTLDVAPVTEIYGIY